MKDSSGDMPQFAAYCAAVKGENFSMLVGTAGALYPAMALGADGGILAIANSNPRECLAVYESYQKGELAESRELYERLLPVNTALTGTYGIPGLKAACSMMGYKGGYVRRPLHEINEEQTNAARVILQKAELVK